MWYLAIGIVILGIITALAGYLSSGRRRNHPYRSPAVAPAAVVSEQCCGQHELCERDSLLAAVSKKIDYYDDEELDVYCGFTPEAYSDSAIEEFREVLYTLREEEVAGWLRSLQLRNINLPEMLKDEALLIVEERRNRLQDKT